MKKRSKMHFEQPLCIYYIISTHSHPCCSRKLPAPQAQSSVGHHAATSRKGRERARRAHHTRVTHSKAGRWLAGSGMKSVAGATNSPGSIHTTLTNTHTHAILFSLCVGGGCGMLFIICPERDAMRCARETGRTETDACRVCSSLPHARARFSSIFVVRGNPRHVNPALPLPCRLLWEIKTGANK